MQLANSMVTQAIDELEACDEKTFYKWFQDCEMTAASVGVTLATSGLASYQYHCHNPGCEQSVKKYLRTAIFRPIFDFLVLS